MSATVKTEVRETDLGDAEVATTQQRHRALDAPHHQVAGPEEDSVKSPA
jgi:hypothetical protein